MPQFRYAPLRYGSILLLAWLALFFLTRSALLLTHLAEADVGLLSLFRLYGREPVVTDLWGQEHDLVQEQIEALCHKASRAIKN